MRLSARLLGPLLTAFLITAPAGAQQLQPPSTGGLGELDRALRHLAHDKRVLVIGAHPDDEDTELLTVLTRGEGAEAAYLSLTRGEGGQNLIGPELGDALGLLRTEELLAARHLDGARQFFTRAYDFGFSKTLDDTWAHWPRDSVLKDVVRVVRRFRPQVIVSVFSGTSRDGHGQHQAAGWAAHEAFTAAGDPERFPELAREEGLQPWSPLKLYRSARFDTAATTITLDGGVLDPAVGQSFHQIAMRSRSLHSSQDMGQLQRIGPSRVRLSLVEDRTGEDRSGSDGGALFAHIDTMPAPRYAALADSARRLVGADRMERVRDLLLQARGRLASAGFDGVTLADQRARLDEALAVAGQVMVDALASDERVAPGDTFTLRLQAWNGSADTVTVEPSMLLIWATDSTALAARRVAPGGVGEWTTVVRVPAGARVTAPYFVRAADEAMYRLAEGTPAAVRGLPAAPPPVSVRFRVQIGGGEYTTTREAAFRINDQAIGEVRRPLTIVPPLDVRIEPGSELWAIGDTAPRVVRVTVANGAATAVRGTLRLEMPRGWPAVEPRSFTLTPHDDRETFELRLRAPAELEPGVYRIRAVASAGDVRSSVGLRTVEYPHVRARTYEVPAELVVTAAELSLPRLTRIGYVRGAADRGPEALRAVGLPIEIVEGASLARGDLARFDAIVIGPRAYEVDSGLAAQNRRLLEYAERGGLVLVQYQQYGFFEGDFAPYPMALAPRHDRVADETAEVTVLDPQHPAMRGPNPIDAADWRGWVQERGLYFARSWDERYVPLLALNDPGEQPQRGGLLVAPVGDGTYVYTGLSFFRELPAGVPGAYRLFANLLGLAGERPGRPAS